MKGEWSCENCGWHGKEPVVASSPFDDESIMYGCPECNKSGVWHSCDRPKCTKQAKSGYLLKDGLALLCEKHIPKLYQV